jgi:fumarate hydratase subunit beta
MDEPATRTLQLPLTEDAVRSLSLGDMVYLNGDIVISAGVPTYQRMIEFLDRGERLPLDLTHAALFHLGSYNEETEDGFRILYMNPTTSTRFNTLMPHLIRTLGLRAVGGKGGLDRECANAMKEVGCVYLSFVGGGCPILSDAVKRVVAVEWNDLIAHYRLVKLTVEMLGPLTVAIDAHGNTLYENLQTDARQKLPEILAELNHMRGASAAT